MAARKKATKRRPQQGQGESPTSPRRLEARDRALKALELRKLGLTYDQIAKQTGYKDRRHVHMAVSALLKSTAQEPADEVRRLELERLDMLWTRAMPGVNRGDAKSINACIRILERRSKMLGLDAPVRTELTGADGGPVQIANVPNLEQVPDVELEAFVQRWEAMMEAPAE